MDLVTGETLSDRLRTRGPMSVVEALPIFIQLCFALDYAHSQGVIHRDIKPSNISITALTAGGEQVKILDFGIAKLIGVDTTSLTKVGAVFGTPFYMSPEQCLGQPVDFRSDIYSLGCVFFELLAAAPPFTSEQALSLMMQHQSEKPPSLKEVSMGGQFPAALENLVQKMLAKKPDDRYQRLTDVANDLMEMQQGKTPTIAVPINFAPTERKAGIPSWLLIATLVVSSIAIGGAAMYFVYHKLSSNADRQATPEVKPLRTIADTTNVLATSEDSSDDLLIASRYFSTPIKRHGISYRQFNFPRNTPIGEITYVDMVTNKNVTKNAVGQLEVPCNPGQPCIAVKMGFATCTKAPQLLKKFRPDEVGHLYFEDNDARKALGTDDIYDNTLTFVDDLKSIYAIELPGPVSNVSIPHIAKLPHLTTLVVARTNVTGDALSTLPQLPHLNMLMMSMIRNAKDALPALKHSKQLVVLKLVDDKLKDSDLKNLSGITTLQELTLRGNPGITDAGLTYLAHLPNLNTLTLDGCKITPRSIKTLSKMKIFRHVSLDVSAWSKADIDRLIAAVPYDVRTWNANLNYSVSLRHPRPIDERTQQARNMFDVEKGTFDRGD
jgi:hypothetical protein